VSLLSGFISADAVDCRTNQHSLRNPNPPYLFHLETTVKCFLQTFSEVLMDFSEGLLDFLPKKSFFAQKAIKDFFRGTDGIWDVFRDSDGCFRGRIWQFWWIRAHSFPSKRWKSQCCVLSLYPWSCRFVRPWFCRGLSVMEKEVGHIFGFSGLQQRR